MPLAPLLPQGFPLYEVVTPHQALGGSALMNPRPHCPHRAGEATMPRSQWGAGRVRIGTQPLELQSFLLNHKEANHGWFCTVYKLRVFLEFFRACENKQKQRIARDRGCVWPTQPEVLSVWPFAENSCQALPWMTPLPGQRMSTGPASMTLPQELIPEACLTVTVVAGENPRERRDSGSGH